MRFGADYCCQYDHFVSISLGIDLAIACLSLPPPRFISVPFLPLSCASVFTPPSALEERAALELIKLQFFSAATLAKETSGRLSTGRSLSYPSEEELNLKRSDFPRDFLFGAATSAVQVHLIPSRESGLLVNHIPILA